jgi:hypothetical protein
MDDFLSGSQLSEIEKNLDTVRQHQMFLAETAQDLASSHEHLQALTANFREQQLRDEDLISEIFNVLGHPYNCGLRAQEGMLATPNIHTSVTPAELGRVGGLTPSAFCSDQGYGSRTHRLTADQSRLPQPLPANAAFHDEPFQMANACPPSKRPYFGQLPRTGQREHIELSSPIFTRKDATEVTQRYGEPDNMSAHHRQEREKPSSWERLVLIRNPVRFLSTPYDKSDAFDSST